jgi:hypothetical protein
MVLAIICLLAGAAPMLASPEEEPTRILKVVYVARPGIDVEYGQGAIERNELLHAVLAATEWLIRVSPDDDARVWEERLNRSVDPAHGRFRVGPPSAEELRRVAEGEFRFQR